MLMNSNNNIFHGTTILLVRRGNRTVLAGDGQVTFGDTVLKKNARKIRRVYNNSVLVGFAGATADAFALFSRLESKLEQFQGKIQQKRAKVF